MQKLKKIKKRKLLFKLFSPDEYEKDINYIFSSGKIDKLKENNIKTVVIVSSIAVDPVIFIRLINEFARMGFDVKTHHIGNLDDDHHWPVKNQVDEMHAALKEAGCLVISYGRSYALSIIGCLFLLSGRSIEDSIDYVNLISKKVKLSEDEKTFLFSFQRFLNRIGSDLNNDIVLKKTKNGIIENREDEQQQEDKPAVEIDENKPVDDVIEEIKIEDGSAETIKAEDDTGEAKADTEEDKGILIDKIDEKEKVEKGKPEEKIEVETNEIDDVTTKKETPFYSSIKFKLISIISLIIIISLNGMILVATYFFKKDNVIRIQEKNHNISDLIAHNVSTDLKSIITKSEFLIKTAVKDYSGKNSQEADFLLNDDENILFTGLVSKSDNINEFNITNNIYNRELMDNLQLLDKDLLDAITTNSAIFKGVFHGDTIIHNISQVFQSPVLGLSIPFEVGENRVIKTAIIIFVKLDKFLKTFKPIGLTSPIMLNDKGDVIAHPDSNIVKAGENFLNIPIVKMMMESKLNNGQTKYKDKKGVYYLGSFKKLGIGGAGVIAIVEEEKALQAVYIIQKRNLYLMMTILSITVLIIFLYGKRLTKPIIGLLKATALIKEGQYNVDIKPASNDEIGQLTSSFIEMGKGLEEREKIKDAFGKFVNKEIAEQVLSGEISLGGERKIAAVFFSDIRSFTAISENMEPEEVVEFLNDYMTRMVKCVNQTNGVVDKYIGDAIMAEWGVPISSGNDTENAVNAALLMRAELIDFNKDRGGDKKPIIKIGSGINTGPVLAGQIGSEEKMEYTVIGDTVNLASRIEGLNKPFATDILISEDSFKIVEGIFRVEKMSPISVKGKSEKQQIYTVLGRMDDPESPKTLDELRKLLDIKKVDFKQEDLEQGETKYEIHDV